MVMEQNKSSCSKDVAENESEPLMKKITFRMYNPRSEELKKYIESSEPDDTQLKAWTEEYKAAIDDALMKFADSSTDLDIMAPKKVNWDLKMQLEPKLKTVRRQTQKALVEIVREKAAHSGEGAQLVSAVAQAPQLTSDEEDEAEE